MKKIIVLFIGLFVSTISFAQVKNRVAQRDSLLNEIDEKLASIKYHHTAYGRYKLYPTDNIYILLKLDTQTGVIQLLQWSLNQSEEIEVFVNVDDLSQGEMRETGRFELFPTKNMYQFILLDTLYGSTWHVQWGTKRENIWIRKISWI